MVICNLSFKPSSLFKQRPKSIISPPGINNILIDIIINNILFAKTSTCLFVVLQQLTGPDQLYMIFLYTNVVCFKRTSSHTAVINLSGCISYILLYYIFISGYDTWVQFRFHD